MRQGIGNYHLLCSKYKIGFSTQNKSCGDGVHRGDGVDGSGDGGSTTSNNQDKEEVVQDLLV